MPMVRFARTRASLKDDEAFMLEVKLLKGSVNDDTWSNTSYLDSAYKAVDSNQ